MTVIVAICDGETVRMGADSCRSRGANLEKENNARLENAKVFSAPHGVWVGCSGLVKGHQRIRRTPELFGFAKDGLTKEGIVTAFMPAYRRLMKDYDLLDDDGMPRNTLLLAKGGDLFFIRGFDVYRIRESFAIGSGGAYAAAALAETSLPVEERMMNALRDAATFVSGVGAPFVLTDTKTGDRKEVRA